MLTHPAETSPAALSGDAGLLLDEAVIAELEALGADLLPDLLTLYFSEATSQIEELEGAIGRVEARAVGPTSHKLKAAAARSERRESPGSRLRSRRPRTADDLESADALLEGLRRALDHAREALRARMADG